MENSKKTSKNTIPDLNWWKMNLMNSYQLIKECNFKLERTKHSINYLEQLAMYLGVKSFANRYENCEILIRADNTTAMSYINHMGSSRHIKYNK